MSHRHADHEVCYLCGTCRVSLDVAAGICEARASSLAASGCISEAQEAQKCADAIRRSATT